MRRLLFIAIIGLSILSCVAVWHLMRPSLLVPSEAFSRFTLQHLTAEKQVFQLVVHHQSPSLSGSLVFTGALLRSTSILRGNVAFNIRLEQDGRSQHGVGTATIDTTGSGTVVLVLREFSGSLGDVLRRSLIGGALNQQIILPDELLDLGSRSSSIGKDDGSFLFENLTVGTGMLLERSETPPRLLQKVSLTIRQDSQMLEEFQRRGANVHGAMYIDLLTQELHRIQWTILFPSSSTELIIYPLGFDRDPGSGSIPSSMGPSFYSLFHIISGNTLVPF